ncbi:hypothetical protein LMG19083_03827 [Ralstonia psammae]|uniref:Uncharacterized protein n=1 Tax=Ralstonia psammae TaxID=3058598 RepID=A0ABM9JTP1_9RALS|nr:hypothetical protein [Ralstonia sp. LMG 19083]CAJ0803091.1 hypothetical protein LMG19083_03827 [Ralstonia sp. LMG 19083]
MDKRLWALVAVTAAALGAPVAHASATRDVYTDGSASMDARNPYTDGGLATKFDVYADGAKAGKFDSYTDGMRVPMTDRVH